MVSKHMAKMAIMGELICDSLALPDGSYIERIEPHPSMLGVFVFYVEHGDLPEVKPGDELPEVVPIFTADYDKRPSVWLTVDWNIDTK